MKTVAGTALSLLQELNTTIKTVLLCTKSHPTLIVFTAPHQYQSAQSNPS